MDLGNVLSGVSGFNVAPAGDSLEFLVKVDFKEAPRVDGGASSPSALEVSVLIT